MFCNNNNNKNNNNNNDKIKLEDISHAIHQILYIQRIAKHMPIKVLGDLKYGNLDFLFTNHP